MRIGVYEVLLELGRGGMGAVYLARLSGAGDFERLVAIKRALPQSLADEDTRERFLHEARLAAYVHHANVVGIHQVGTDAVGPYLACDYVEGESLAGLIERTRREARIPPKVALRIAIDALAGLSAIHEAVDGSGRPLGVLHRDVSIENLLVGRDGVTRITDFGIAKSSVSPVRTDTGAIHGKLLYLTPEYLQGSPPDRTCDTYAMGITLFAALTSTYPFRTEDVNFLVEQIVSAQMPTLRSRGVDAHEELEAFLAKAVAKDRAARFPDAPSMLEALERAAAAGDGVARQQEVAAFVERVAGKELKARREAVQARRTEVAPVSTEIPAQGHATPALPETLKDARLGSAKPPPRQADARMTIAAALVFGLVVLGYVYLQGSPKPAVRDTRGAVEAPRDAAAPPLREAAAQKPEPTLVVPEVATITSIVDAASAPEDAATTIETAPEKSIDSARPRSGAPNSRPPRSSAQPDVTRPPPAQPTPSASPPPQKPGGVSLDNPYR